jgi:hypothetical protein
MMLKEWYTSARSMERFLDKGGEMKDGLYQKYSGKR